MFAVLLRHDRLGVGCLEHPALLYPFPLECRDDALDMREILVQYLLLAHCEQRVVHWAIIAEIDQAPFAIFRGRTEVGVFKQAREGKTGVADIDPVAVRKLAIQREYETMSAVCLAPIVLCTVVLG